LATEHEKTVADELKSAGVSNVIIGHVRERDTYPSVFVVPTGGPAPSPFFGTDSTSYKQAAVQITIVGDPRDYQAASQVARDCYDAVDHTVPTGYTAFRPRSSAPLNLGVDEQDRPFFTVNVLCQIVE
jgi:hypothetical protein